MMAYFLLGKIKGAKPPVNLSMLSTEVLVSDGKSIISSSIFSGFNANGSTNSGIIVRFGIAVRNLV